ncbi:MAG: GTPase domain-containing protein [Candidatus Lokiarchaeota archaeon]|nr:GTPase domain-containing protein [Candidatus Lokiarchaeota archaeon]
MSGKTTSIKCLFKHYNKINTLKSIENSLGRTLVFDFGVLKFEGIEWTLKFLIYTATGQDFYASTRTSTLKGADGIIFVIDSNYEHLNRNKRSWNELNLFFGGDIYNIPILIAFNKYDLVDDNNFQEEDFISREELEKYCKISLKKTIATNGTGIIESFNLIINSIFPNITLKT